MPRKIIQNEVQCNECGNRIFSAHRHDFVRCSCGSVAVDGGMEYTRRVFKTGADYTDQTMTMDIEDLDKCIQAVKWAKDNNRNDFGVALAVIRALRDTGYLNMKMFKDQAPKHGEADA